MTAHSGIPETTLQLGRRIYIGPCASCHSADPISLHSLPEWGRILAEMAPKAKLDTSREAALRAYITAAHAARVPPPNP